MTIALRRFNNAGLSEFKHVLDALRVGDDNAEASLTVLLDDEQFSEKVSPPVSFDTRIFRDRMEFAEYAFRQLNGLDIGLVSADAGLWSWLTVLYFDQVCPKMSDGNRKVLKEPHYVFKEGSTRFDFRNSYRHHLWLAWRVYSQNPKQPSQVLLRTPLSVHPEIAEQIAGRQEFLTAPCLLSAADLLYWDAVGGKVKSGVAGKKSPATIRRLALVAGQLDLTFDLYGMTGEEFVDLLPSEFDRFRS